MRAAGYLPAARVIKKCILQYLIYPPLGKKLYISIWMLCLCFVATGQNFYNITHTSGYQTIGNISVKVTPIRGASSQPTYTCGAGPYQIGVGNPPGYPDGYTFQFSTAVRQVRFRIAASEPGEDISFSLNGNPYLLTNSDVSNYVYFNCGTQNGYAISSRGTLEFTNMLGNNTSMVTIDDSIVSVSIQNVDYSAGSMIGVDFLVDTVVNIKGFTDTLLCAGDTMDIKYYITGTYAPNNTFTFQMSDTAGIFTNPYVLKVLPAVTSGEVRIPAPAMPSGKGYRIRVVSSNPQFISEPTAPIAIGNPPIGLISNTGPVCKDSYAQLQYRSFSHITEVRWSRPGQPAFSKLQFHPFLNVQMSDSGLYIGEMEDYGCLIYDTTRLTVYPIPINILGSNNSPVCEQDTISITANERGAGVQNVWFYPSGASDTVNDVTILKAKPADSGMYVLQTTMNGCTAQDSVFVKVKKQPHPGLRDIAACVTDSLVLRIDDTTSGAVYEWSGPAGYYSNSKDTVIKQISGLLNGNYVVKVTADGCTAIDTMQVNVKPLPPVPVAADIKPMCAGETLILAADNTMMGVVYTWTGPGGFSAAGSSISVGDTKVSHTGLYTITANLNGCMTIDTVSALVKYKPIIPVAAANTPLYTGETLKLQLTNHEQGMAYQWAGPDGFTSNLLHPEIPYIGHRHTGTYTVTASADGCISSGIVLVQVFDKAEPGYLVLYPSPNNGNFSIKGSLGADQYISLKVMNAIGQKLHSEIVPVSGAVFEHHVNLAGKLASGIYTLRIGIDGRLVSLKFMVK